MNGQVTENALQRSASNGSKADDVGRIHTIYSPADQDISNPLDIIAIHGERGDWELSWTDPKTKYSWIAQGLPEAFPQARIISCAHKGIREKVVENLIWDLIDDRTARKRQNTPMIIIAHSFGGIIAKQLFVASAPMRTTKDEIKSFHSCIKGFALFGTLNRGHLNSQFLKSIATWSWLIGQLVDADFPQVPQFTKTIPQINDDFRICGGEEVPTVSFYEMRPTQKFGFKGTIVSEDAALLPNAENRGLDKDHSNLIKFSGPSSGSYQQVLGSMRRLVDKALVWKGVPKRIDHSIVPAKFGTRVLSLDGGGVRGLFSALVLEAVMEEVRKIDAPDSPDPLKPCNYFDMICGTSTGGLLALMLGRLRMDVRSCVGAYREISEQVFRKNGWSFPGKDIWDNFWLNPQFSGEKLEAEIKATLDRHLSLQERTELQRLHIRVEDAPLRELSHSDVSRDSQFPKCFVCAVLDGQRGVDRLRTYESVGNTSATGSATVSTTNPALPDLTIWQAGRATSAAPSYFPPITISGRRYFDGGMGSNNPILEAYIESAREFTNRDFAAIVSIGTGANATSSFGIGALGFIHGLVNRVTDTETADTQFGLLYPGLSEKYFRLQEIEGLGAIGLGDWEKLDLIEQKAGAYLAKDEVRDVIKDCARRLARNGVHNATVAETEEH